MRYVSIVVLSVVALVGVSRAVSAQSVVLSPTEIQWQASPDHAATIPGTATNVVSGYTVTVLSGATSVITAASLGKPAPDAAGQLKFQIGSVPGYGALPRNVVYTAFVTVVGPGGSDAYTASGPFAVPGAPRANGPTVVK